MDLSIEFFGDCLQRYIRSFRTQISFIKWFTMRISSEIHQILEKIHKIPRKSQTSSVADAAAIHAWFYHLDGSLGLNSSCSCYSNQWFIWRWWTRFPPWNFKWFQMISNVHRVKPFDPMKNLSYISQHQFLAIWKKKTSCKSALFGDGLQHMFHQNGHHILPWFGVN